jgi:hypothetical protein
MYMSLGEINFARIGKIVCFMKSHVLTATSKLLSSVLLRRVVLLKFPIFERCLLPHYSDDGGGMHL